MANSFTESAYSPVVMGNQVTRFGVYNAADGAGSSVASGLKYITHGQMTQKSSTTGGVTLTINANVDGDFQVLSGTSGDTFNVILFGTR